MAQPHISVAAETLFQVGPVPITNALLSTWVVMAILFILSFIIQSGLKKKPGKFQVVAEMVVGGLYSFFKNLGGSHGASYAPLAMTFFLFIIVSNWFGLLPGVGTIGFYEGAGEAHASKLIKTVEATEVVQVEENHEAVTVPVEPGSAIHEGENEAVEEEAHGRKFVPILRGPTADLNTTIALAIISFVAIQYFGLKFAGAGYLKRFIDIRSPIFFFVGLLEAISDVSKILSFAFRLFGNVFAGEVLLAIMAFLFAFFLPIPFYGLEIFVGFIQALVFGMLTTVFINVAVSHGEHVSGHHDH